VGGGVEEEGKEEGEGPEAGCKGGKSEGLSREEGAPPCHVRGGTPSVVWGEMVLVACCSTFSSSRSLSSCSAEAFCLFILLLNLFFWLVD